MPRKSDITQPSSESAKATPSYFEGIGRLSTSVQLPRRLTVSGGTGGGGGGGTATVIVTDAVTPAIVAVNVVAPVAIAVTSPLPSTVATAGCDDVHDTGSPR